MGFTKKQCREQQKSHNNRRNNIKRVPKYPRKEVRESPPEAVKE